MPSVEGKILSIVDRSTVVINRGSRDGVVKEMRFYIYTEIGPFTDPDTGEALGSMPRVWGKVVVYSVAEKLCLAETEYRYMPGYQLDLARIFGGTRVQIQLPVDEAEIRRSPEKIRVGTLVRGALPEPKELERKIPKELAASTEPDEKVDDSVDSVGKGTEESLAGEDAVEEDL